MRPSYFSIYSNCQQVVDCSNQKKIKFKHHDYEESCGFYNRSNAE